MSLFMRNGFNFVDVILIHLIPKLGEYVLPISMPRILNGTSRIAKSHTKEKKTQVMANNAVRQIVAAATNAIENDDDDDFENLVNRTRRHFRRNVSTSRRGRRAVPKFKRKTLLLKRSNSEYCPIRAECEMLTSIGLGYSNSNPQFDLSWDKTEMDEYIYSLYPTAPLELVGFKLAKMDRQKKLSVVDVQSVAEIKETFGQSQIVLIPNRDLPSGSGRSATVSSIRNTAVERPNLNFTGSPNRVNTTNPSSRVNNNTISSPNRVDYTPHSARLNNTSSPIRPSVSINMSELPEVSYSFMIPQDQTIDNNDGDNNSPVIPVMDDNAEVVPLNINRNDCVREMFIFYENNSITEKRLDVRFIGELGIDGGGLTKELFNLFFKEIENIYFMGEECLVPFLPLNRIRKEKDNFIVIGRILEHMLLLTGSVPTKLSKIMLILIADPEADIEKEVIMAEFYQFVNQCERFILKKAADSFDEMNTKEKDILANIFTTYQFHELPKKTEIVDQIMSIACNTLIEIPKQFISKMREGVQIDKYRNFWQKCDFATLLDLQKPTPAKVANSLRTLEENLTNDENRVLHFLEMYVRCLDNRIGQFLFLVTGSYQMPDNITVDFTKIVGFCRRPTFSTCTNTIHVPCSYSNYQELKSEFDICLNSEEAYVYSEY